MTIERILFVVGLLFDICGAFFLAQSFIAKNLEDLTFEGTSGYGSPPNLRYIRSNLFQKAEAWIGFVMLAMGFMLQSNDYFLFASPSKYTMSTSVVILFLLGLLILLCSLGGFVRTKLFNHYAFKMAAIVIRETPPKGERDDSWIITVGKYLLPQFKRQPNEDDQTFSDRMLSKLNIHYG
jgi:hypothetical protein